MFDCFLLWYVVLHTNADIILYIYCLKLQELNEKRMHNLKNETRKVIKSIINQFNQKNEKTLLDYYTEFEQDVLHVLILIYYIIDK